MEGLVEDSKASGSGEGTQGEIQGDGELISQREQVTVCTTWEPIKGPYSSTQGESIAPTWDETPGSTRPNLDSTDTPMFDSPITVPLVIVYPDMRPDSVCHSHGKLILMTKL